MGAESADANLSKVAHAANCLVLSSIAIQDSYAMSSQTVSSDLVVMNAVTQQGTMTGEKAYSKGKEEI